KRLEAEEKRRLATEEKERKRLEAEQAKEAARLAAEQKKQEKQAAENAATEPTRRALQPGQPPPVQRESAAAPPLPTSARYLSGASSGLLPAADLKQAQADPRFRVQGMVEDAKVKVVSVAGGYPYFGIPQNGCSAGKSFVMGELLAPFDGMSAGTALVLRIEDPKLGPARTGAALAFSGLRRAGKGKDGTFVYCGKGTAFPVRR
ncbi:MAG: hypothetical protein ACOZIN_19835, partial [Myxococcota bacterium]